MQEKLCSGTAVARMAVVRGRDTVPVEPIAILGPVYDSQFRCTVSACGEQEALQFRSSCSGMREHRPVRLSDYSARGVDGISSSPA